ncbi:sensor histidine kinase/response regulator [Flavobacterium limnosediminis JC2902]|uniref:histidine kinase n=1 Tax=Flavobacterium limnosediminis JC2902 TaxID=1341181 RepID=V6SLU3_9FLAO|nr:HAMP domain-containing sensor histidine kinase [Flavobacterium limnosediminis]ESU27197.1 sensor histidine kinase/response regulator [Flavobacterium limnosediminis JC2902]
MLPFSFKNRIAFNYIISTALLISFVFIVLFQTVKLQVYNHINEDIDNEIVKHLGEIEIDDNDNFKINVDNWREREHNTVDVNPVFVAFLDMNNKLIDKSPNLKGLKLHFLGEQNNHVFVDTSLNNIPIRQIQTEIKHGNKVVGHLIVAMSLDDAEMVLINLRNILLISFPLILLVLFIIARIIAGRSIKPVSAIIETSSVITKDNLSSRIELPKNKDELYQLSKTINELLDRIENAVEREKQFTSDASHELRTPLAVIKGTLEVLIRKPRTKEEYTDKINFCVSEVDRLNNLVDQLLLLARFENQKQFAKREDVLLNSTFLDIITRLSPKSQNKNITVTTNFPKEYYVKTDNYLLSIIVGNLISNALKYTPKNGTVSINMSTENGKTVCKIKDNGIGIKKEELDKIFEQFYRSDASVHPEIKGTGLGLSIVKKLCLLLSIQIEISSTINEGTEVVLIFP